MIIALLTFLKDLFRGPTVFDRLEEHILAGKPQNAADVESLERGFWDRHQREVLWHFKE